MQATTAAIEGGEILGVRSADGEVVRFLGVPYAAPPVAGLRWRPPEPVVPWQGVLETTHFAPAAPQPLPPPGSFYQREFFLSAERQSEDCLYLNVYAPAHASQGRSPVMVWLHGGGFVQGSGSLPSFDGDALSRKGVVLVTINYRLGPLGFLALPELDAESSDRVSGNYGLLDVIAALRWVQTNIGAFGGDAGNVTIFGQSAGGISVSAMMASPLARNLFRRAIVQSGPMFGVSAAMQSLAQAQAGGAKFKDALGARALAELRMLSAADLLRKMGDNSVGFGLRPCVDGYVLPRDMPEMIAAGDQNGDALLIGSNYNEGTALMSATTPEELRAHVRRRFGDQGEALADIYRGGDAPSAFIAQDRMLSDYLIAASARQAAVIAARGKPAYVYRFARSAPGSDPKEVGAFHSAELAYVFGTQASINRPWQARDRELVEQMQSYWTNFARTGDPNGAGLPTWPRIRLESELVMELGEQSKPIEALEPRAKALFDGYLSGRVQPGR